MCGSLPRCAHGPCRPASAGSSSAHAAVSRRDLRGSAPRNGLRSTAPPAGSSTAALRSRGLRDLREGRPPVGPAAPRSTVACGRRARLWLARLGRLRGTAAPSRSRSVRRFDSPRRLALAEPLFHDQPHRLDAPPLQCDEVPLHAFWKTHIQKTSALSKRLPYITRDSVELRRSSG